MDITGGIIKRLFSRTDCYAYASERSGKVRYYPSYYADPSTPLLPVDEEVIQHHLQGTRTIGSYVLNEDRCRFAAIDVDVYEGDPKQVGWRVAQELRGALISLGIPSDSMLTEFSGRKGYHVWILLQELTEASAVRRVLRAAVQEIGFTIQGTSMAQREGFPGHLELFPKSDEASGRFGNLIKLPLGIHQATGLRSALYDPTTGHELPNEALLHTQPLMRSVLNQVANQCPEVTVVKQQFPRVQQRVTQRLLPVSLPQLCDHVQGMAQDSLSYEQWKNLGILLAVCEGGDKVFHDISSQDSRYDPVACDDLVRSTRTRNLNPPRCTTLGCTGDCGVKNPLVRCFPRRYRSVRIEMEQPVEKSLEQCRDELGSMLDELLDDVEGINLVVAPCGLGKTTQLLQKLHGVKTLTLAPNHGQAPHCLSSYPGVHLRSRQQLQEQGILDCPHIDDISSEQQLNLPVFQKYCSSCENKDGCEYLNLIDKARSADHVVAVHAHLAAGVDPRILAGRLVVVDEPLWSWYRREHTFTPNDVIQCRYAALEMDAESLLQELDALYQLTMEPTGRHEVALSVTESFREEWMGHITELTGRNLLPDLLNASTHGNAISWDGREFKYTQVAGLYPNMIILDAFGDRDFYEAVLGRQVQVWEPPSVPKQQVQVHQVLDGAYPNASFCREDGGSLDTILKAIDGIIDKHQQTPAFITTKWLRGKLEERYPDSEFMHYGNLVGRDDFRDKPLVIRVGYMGLGYQNLATATRVLFGLEWDDDEKAEQLQQVEQVWVPINYSHGGAGYEVPFKHFPDKHVQMYYDHVVMGEADQADGRCRPYQGSGDYYIICNIPSRLRVEPLILRQPTKAKQVREWVARQEPATRFKSAEIPVACSDKHKRRVLAEMRQQGGVALEGSYWVKLDMLKEGTLSQDVHLPPSPPPASRHSAAKSVSEGGDDHDGATVGPQTHGR